MNSRTKLLRACCAALVVFAAGPAASAYLPVPFDEAALASMHSVGIVDGPEPDECNVYVYTSAFGGGSFRSDIERAAQHARSSFVREFIGIHPSLIEPGSGSKNRSSAAWIRASPDGRYRTLPQ